MNRTPGQFSRIVSFCCMAAAMCVLACAKSDPTPKREDHQAAHSQRYHPDVERVDPASSVATQATSQPSNTPNDDGTYQWANTPVGCPVMFINGEPISIEQVLEPVYENLAELSETLNEQDYSFQLLRTIRSRIEQEMGLVLVNQEAVNHYPDAAGAAFEKEAARQIRDTINRRFGGVHARYEEHLRRLKLSANDMMERQKRQVMAMQYMREHLTPLLRPPSRQELLDEFNGRREEFAAPPKAELFVIEIPFQSELNGKLLPNASDEEREAARMQASDNINKAKAALDNGEEFTAVAKTRSRGIAVASGGLVGEISPGALVERYSKVEQMLFALGENAISDVIETDDAFFIVKCGKFTPARQPDFEKAQKELTDRLLERQYAERRAEYIQKLLSKATVLKLEEFTHAVFAASPRPPRYR